MTGEASLLKASVNCDSCCELFGVGRYAFASAFVGGVLDAAAGGKSGTSWWIVERSSWLYPLSCASNHPMGW
jgi:hypothetical protein